MSRFLPTNDKVQIESDTQAFFEQELFKSKLKAQTEYKKHLAEILKQCDVADEILSRAMINIQRSLDSEELASTEMILEIKTLKLSIKIDPNYPECIEPLQEVNVWIKAALHLYNCVNQIHQFTAIVGYEISQDYIRRVKNFLEDFNLLLKEHKLIEGMSPFSFKNKRQPFLKSAHEFDHLLLKSLKVVKAIQIFATESVQLAIYYVDFVYNLGDAIEISPEYMDMINTIIGFYGRDTNFQEIRDAAKILSHKQFCQGEEITLFTDQIGRMVTMFDEFRKELNLVDFIELQQIFTEYQKQQQPIYSLEQLRGDLLFILCDEEDFETIMRNFKPICVQANQDLQMYEKLIEQLLEYVHKQRDKRVQNLKDQQQLELYLKEDKKDWQAFFKQAIIQSGAYLQDFDKKEPPQIDRYLKEVIPLRKGLKNTYSGLNLMQVYDKFIDLFKVNIQQQS